jgi:phosphomannomutase
VLVGNPPSQRHTVGVSYWGPGGAFWSSDEAGSLAVARAAARHDSTAIARQVRSCGGLSRRRVGSTYHEGFRDYFHALRPLRVRVETSCALIAERLAVLGQGMACPLEIVDPADPQRGVPSPGGQATRRPAAPHFTIAIDGDGEACQVRDEQDREIAGDQIVALFAVQLCREQPGATIVLEKETDSEVFKAIKRAGGKVASASDSREATALAMRNHSALLAGGPSGRVWFGHPTPHPDALRALATLLVLLSQSDRALSEVLDAAIFGAR